MHDARCRLASADVELGSQRAAVPLWRWIDYQDEMAAASAMEITEAPAACIDEQARRSRMSEARKASGRRRSPIVQIRSLLQANEALRASSDKLVATDSLEAFLETTVRHAIDMSSADAGGVLLPSEDESSLEILSPLERDRESGALVPITSAISDRPLTGTVRDVWEDIKASAAERWQAIDGGDSKNPLQGCYEGRGIRRIVDVPIRLRGATLGHLRLGFASEDTPSEAQLQVVRVLAQQTALAIGMKRLGERTRRVTIAQEREAAVRERLADLPRANDAMRVCAEQLTSLHDLQSFLGSVVRTSVEVCGAAAGSIGMMNASKTEIRFVAISEESAEGEALAVPEGVDGRLPMTQSAQRAWSEIEAATMCWWTTPSDPACTVALRAWHRRRRHRQIACFPIRLHGVTLGFLALSYRSGDKQTDVQSAISRVLAHQAALAMGMTQVAEAAQHAAVNQERARQLDLANEALRRSIERTAADESVSNVLSSILDESAQLVGATGGLISAMEASQGNPFHPVAILLQGRRLSIPEWLDVSGIESVAERSVEDPSGFFGRIRKGDEVVLQVDREDALWWPDALAFMLRIGAKMCLSLPVRSRGSVVGLLKLWLPQAEPPTADSFAQLRAFAHQAALSLELIRFRERTSKAATEAERARVAGEIHDGLAQAFMGVLMQARAARIFGRQHKRKVTHFLDSIESLAAEGLEEARRSLFALRSTSLEGDGLVPTLERLVRNLSIDGRTRCVFVNHVEKLAASPLIEDAVYRIVQEATQNALKHSDAREIQVKLEQESGGLRVSIQDDGTGIPGDVVQRARERGGLRAMWERARSCGGDLTVESRAPNGTWVSVLFPDKGRRT